ncbi:MAG: 50S ribosomal protein L9 [Lachnospiraceae bacterium]|nr:50S ribosomal protein L9 [Lachnospiraceae bacterium]MBP5255044.1 50S ribosomal protein L9 [Lachnospiraceae bacterium]
MDIILLQDIKNLGKKGDQVTVKDGYGRNLVSKKQAAEATAKVKNDLKLQKIHEEKVAEERLKEAEALAAALSGMAVTLKIKVGKDGKAFGSVSAKEIADACKAQLALDVDKKKLVLPESIKETGKKEVQVRLHPKVTGILKVNVEAE